MKPLCHTLPWALAWLLNSGCAETVPASRHAVSYRSLLTTSEKRQRLEQRYPGLPAVHLFNSHRLGHRYQGQQWWFDHEHTLRYLLLASRSGTFTTFTVTTKKGQRLAAVELVALFPDGKLKRFGRKDLHVQHEDDGTVTYKFIYPHTVKGTVIHERYVLRWPDAHKVRGRLMRHRLMLRSYLPVLEQRVEFRFPRNWKISVKTPGHPLGNHLKWSFSGPHWQVIRYTRNNVPPLPAEPYTSSTAADGEYLAIQIQRLIHRRGVVMRPTEWKHVSMVVKAVHLEATGDARRYLAPVAQAIVAGRRNRQARQRAIIRYVQRSFSLRDGVDWSIPNVLRAVGGSPMQITALTYHLLRQVGIPVEFVLIHDAADGVFDRSFVSMSELDIPALLLNVGGQGKLAFPWLSNAPIGLVPARFQGQTAMRISSAGVWKLYTMATPKGASSATDDVYRIRIDRQGRGWIQALERYLGFSAVRMRDRLQAMSPVVRAHYLAVRVRGPGQRKPVGNTRVTNLHRPQHPLILESGYPMEGLWVTGPGERTLRLHPLSPGKRTVLRRLARRIRPITITANRSTARRYEITYPRGWRLVNPPKSGFYKNCFGSFRQTVSRRRGRIEISQKLWFKRVRRPAHFAPALQRLLLEISRRSGIQLQLQTTPQPGTNLP